MPSSPPIISTVAPGWTATSYLKSQSVEDIRRTSSLAPFAEHTRLSFRAVAPGVASSGSHIPVTDNTVFFFLGSLAFFLTAVVWNLYIQYGWDRDAAKGVDAASTKAMAMGRMAGDPRGNLEGRHPRRPEQKSMKQGGSGKAGMSAGGAAELGSMDTMELLKSLPSLPPAGMKPGPEKQLTPGGMKPTVKASMSLA